MQDHAERLDRAIIDHIATGLRLILGLVLALLVGIPAGAFALWPSLFFSSEAPVASGPVVESVALNVNETPAAPEHNPVLEALRRAQAQEAEAGAAQQFDVTRRTVRNRRSPVATTSSSCRTVRSGQIASPFRHFWLRQRCIIT